MLRCSETRSQRLLNIKDIRLRKNVQKALPAELVAYILKLLVPRTDSARPTPTQPALSPATEAPQPIDINLLFTKCSQNDDSNRQKLRALHSCLSVSKLFHSLAAPLLWRHKVMECVTWDMPGLPMEYSDFPYSCNDKWSISLMALAITGQHYAIHIDRETGVPNRGRLPMIRTREPPRLGSQMSDVSQFGYYPGKSMKDPNAIALYVPHGRKLTYNDMMDNLTSHPNPDEAFWESGKIRRVNESVERDAGPGRLLKSVYEAGLMYGDGIPTSPSASGGPIKSRKRRLSWTACSDSEIKVPRPPNSAPLATPVSPLHHFPFSDSAMGVQRWDRVNEMLRSGKGHRSSTTFFLLFPLPGIEASVPRSVYTSRYFNGSHPLSRVKEQVYDFEETRLRGVGTHIVLRCEVMGNKKLHIVDASAYKKCRVCRTYGEVLICSRCRCAWYCGIDCQRVDYDAHERSCFAMAGVTEQWKNRRQEFYRQLRHEQRRQAVPQ